MQAMSSLGIFIDEQDISLLLARLNTDPEIAFIALDGLLSDRQDKFVLNRREIGVAGIESRS